jgi:transcriptional regulator of heat shock response
MTEITPRQKKILTKAIEEYIRTAQPVSSLTLAKKYNFNVSSATIRNEMMTLVEKDFLFQPYSSSGRVPTNKGYHFFVSELIDKVKPQKILLEHLKSLEKEMQDLVSFAQNLTRILNNFSSCLILNYIFEKDFLWKEGWPETILEPEFKDQNYLKKFIKLVEETEKKIQEIIYSEPFDQVKIFVGKENPIVHYDEFSMIFSRVRFPKTRKGACLAFLGPKRMPYRKNLQTLYTLLEFLTKI